VKIWSIRLLRPVAFTFPLKSRSFPPIHRNTTSGLWVLSQLLILLAYLGNRPSWVTFMIFVGQTAWPASLRTNKVNTEPGLCQQSVQFRTVRTHLSSTHTFGAGISDRHDFYRFRRIRELSLDLGLGCVSPAKALSMSIVYLYQIFAIFLYPISLKCKPSHEISVFLSNWISLSFNKINFLAGIGLLLNYSRNHRIVLLNRFRPRIIIGHKQCYIGFHRENLVYKITKVDVTMIYEKGYSTKGEGRGLGLGIVNDIVSKYKNVILNTCADDSKFRQELIINLWACAERKQNFAAKKWKARE